MNEEKKEKSPGVHSLGKWIRTHDEYGLKANFDVTCPHCNEKMFVRTSELSVSKRNYTGRIQAELILYIMYKCIPCAYCMIFHVGSPYIDNDYWGKILKLRDNHFLWVPPPETWSDDAKVHERLKALGYVGGDYEIKDITEIEEKK